MRQQSDLHVHSYYSPCAHGVDETTQPLAAPERLIRRAQALGLTEIVFTDHFVEDPTAPGMVLFYKGSGPAIIRSLKDELSRLPLPSGLDVYVGCETETLSTEWVGVGPETAAQLDFILAPTTHYHLPGVPQPRSWAPADVADHMLTMLDAVAAMPWIDAIAHPFAERESLIGDLRAIYEAMETSRLCDVLGRLAHNGIALEVNGSCFGSDALPHYGTVYGEIVGLARKVGLRFTYGSDAHDFRLLGFSSAAEMWLRTVQLHDADWLTATEIKARRGRT